MVFYLVLACCQSLILSLVKVSWYLYYSHCSSFHLLLQYDLWRTSSPSPFWLWAPEICVWLLSTDSLVSYSVFEKYLYSFMYLQISIPLSIMSLHCYDCPSLILTLCNYSWTVFFLLTTMNSLFLQLTVIRFFSTTLSSMFFPSASQIC